MQISYLYALVFPAHQTSRNNNELVQSSFWSWLSIVLIILRNAQINRRYQSEILSPVFNPEKNNTFPYCLRENNAPKEVAKTCRGESRGISLEI